MKANTATEHEMNPRELFREHEDMGGAEDLLLESYRYDLPKELIAQRPLEARESSSLMVLKREGGALEHRSFFELPEILPPGTLLVINNSRVVPASLAATRETGARVEILVLEPLADGKRPVAALAKGKIAAGESLSLEDGTKIEVAERRGRYAWLAFPGGETVLETLTRLGRPPLPPYIKRDRGPHEEDFSRYQTVYAKSPGSVAAPTAGLHFTEEVLERLESRGIEVARIALHVGVGTFLPVTEEDVRNHRMAEEEFFIPGEAADAVNRARAEKRKVIAVGTTVTRALESSVDERGAVLPGGGHTDLFIYPGHRFRAMEGLLTNFHLPGSTLIMLVAAFLGRKRLLNAYAEAVRRGYRFYSYGDAMLTC